MTESGDSTPGWQAPGSSGEGPDLGVDFGTSNTVAVIRRGDGPIETLLFDGSPLLVSAVFADPGGRLLTGRDATHTARSRPERFEPNPKRRVDDGVVLLGDAELPVADLIAAVLARVVAEASRVAGRPPRSVTLTHPVSWGPRRLALLARAAEIAGIRAPRLTPEPVAAAFAFLALPDVTIRPGRSVVVYDLGGGTFDATVMRRTESGFTATATEGLGDVGGLDIDAAIFGYLGAALGARAAGYWHRLEWPESATDRRAARLLWDDIRIAKELLSRASSATVHIPLLDDDVPLGREQLERLARPVLDRTVNTTRNAMRAAGVTADDVDGLFLVGGPSRMPLASTLLFQRLGITPTVVENPELVVARGSLGVPAPAQPAEAPPGDDAATEPVPDHQAAPRAHEAPPPYGTTPITALRPYPAAPSNPAPSNPAPSTFAPNTPAPSNPAPSSPAPSTFAPNTPALGSPGPRGLAPGAPTPGSSGPRNPAPKAPAPGAAAPGAPAPRAPVPGAAAPVADAPATSTGRSGRLVAALAAAVALVLVVAGAAYGVTQFGNDDNTSDGVTGSPTASPTVSEPPPACGRRLAVIGPLTGDFATFGQSSFRGATLAVDAYNREHPSCTVTLSTYDTTGTQDTAADVAQRAVADTALVGAVGPSFSSETKAVGPIFEQAGLPFITPSATAPSLADNNWQTFHRIIGDDDATAPAAKSYLHGELRAERIVVVDDGSDYGKNLADKVVAELGRTVGRESLAVGQTALDGVVGRIAALKPDAVFLGGYFDSAGLMRKQLTAAGVTAPMVTGDGVKDTGFLEYAGSAGDGTVTLCPCSPPEKADAAFIRSHRAKFGADPGIYAAEAYDAASVFLAAIGTGRSTRAAVLEAVDRYDRKGLTARVRFDQRGEVRDPTVWAYRFTATSIVPLRRVV
ncbi:ABC transporter substrate-binding protein [Cryptosporangium aurantiacum]|uniref:Hsp70 protein n=1 Tax=Cryptosporangium aurantiacum TaxID=134849 RepID=A0A1M7RPM0_9ACTN|nr:ABC transporter substrate-binding protein [Cryptosporangium aurantiacum]SHN48120.1 Hsp70 protein [Cryptosporangium aurantiacum]